MRISCFIILLSGLLPIGVMAQSAAELLDRMDNRDRGMIVSRPAAWVRTRLSDLDVCSGTSTALTLETAAQFRASILDRLTATGMISAKRKLAPFDTDQDGQIMGAEARSDERKLNRYRDYYDYNNDDEITLDEIERRERERASTEEKILGGCDKMFAFDVNQDGKVEITEIQSITEIVSAAVRSPPGPKDRCILPKVEYHRSAGFDVFGVGRGEPNADGIPEVELRVSGRSNPVFMLVLSQEPTVWRHTGDPDDVAILIVAGEALDVIGLPPEKVTFVPRSDCTTFKMMDPLSAEGYIVEGQISYALGWDSVQIQMVETAAHMPARR